LPSNLRLTTRKCVHLVTCGHFRSRDNGDHTIPPAISKNPVLHVNFMVVYVSYRTGVIRDHTFTLRELEFLTLFAPVTLTLTDDFHIRTRPVAP